MIEIKDVKLEENVSLKNYNTYKLDGTARYFATVSSIDGLKELLAYLREQHMNFFILGAGSNIILDDTFDGVVIKLSGLNTLTITDKQVVVGAGVMMGKLTRATVDASLTGLEWAINIPGTVGGSIHGNAGAYNSEIFDLLVRLKVLTKDLKVKTISKDELEYCYRHTNIADLGYIVLEATFELEDGNREDSLELIESRCNRRKESQPLDMPSAGSVFRNPDGDFAGRLIEEAGLKGKQIGGAAVSKKHANFIVNTGSATSKDIKNLIQLVHDIVLERFGVDLILEQEILDWK